LSTEIILQLFDEFTTTAPSISLGMRLYVAATG
jgi:hypothetical protein